MRLRWGGDVADPAVLSDLPWPLPEYREPVPGLLARWSEPHRRYHTAQHLAECLVAADDLGAGTVELLALWLHDAVHTSTPGRDESASAALARQLLAGALEPERVDEVARLVLLTRLHRPAPGDLAGAMVCDADLWILGASPARYDESVRQLRAESGLSATLWPRARRAQITTRLADPIFHTPSGRGREPRARDNLHRELAGLDVRPGRT